MKDDRLDMGMRVVVRQELQGAIWHGSFFYAGRTCVLLSTFQDFTGCLLP